MHHTRQTKFVMYLDNFLEAKTLHSLQETLLTLKYGESKDGTGRIIGKRHTFPKSFHDDPLLKLIKGYFFPHRNLVPISVSAHKRINDKEAMFHRDIAKDNAANFLFFAKGEPLLNNGTGFMHNNSLSSHIGFVENRALFFNGAEIPHSDLQSFGESSERYTLNIFYREEF